MATIDEIISAAALLSPADLRKLRSAIEGLDRHAKAIVLEAGSMTFRLYRQTDGEQWSSHRQSLAIDEDYIFYLRLQRLRQPGHELNLAQVYLTLKHLTGDSSCYLDDYKMAFSFPFAMDVIKGNRTFAYLLEVRNIRDSLYLSLRKPVDRGDKRLKDHLIHPPFEDEFGIEEMRFFRSCFYGYLWDRWQTLRPEQLQPFVCRVPADHIIFGYCNGRAFEKQFHAKFESAWRRFQKQVERERKSKKGG